MTLSPKAAKTVIIGLISRSVIKPEHVHRLITAWADSDPTAPESAAFWQQVFEAQGATHAPDSLTKVSCWWLNALLYGDFDG